MPKVSICIPTYNQTKYLSKTLTSIFSQSYTDYEVILTDDSTSSVVFDLITSLKFQDRIRYFHNGRSLGPPKNWNFCISKATGDYIKIMHHDDWFSTGNSLRIMVDALETSQASMAFPNADVFFESTEGYGSYTPGKHSLNELKYDLTLLFRKNVIGAPSMTIFRRDENIVFDKNLKWLIDVDFYMAYLRKHKTFFHIDDALVTIVADAKHTVTATCLYNEEIELFENFYVFNKLRNTFSFLQALKNIKHLLNLLRRFGISNLTHLKTASYGIEFPIYFNTIFLADKAVRKTLSAIIRIFR